MEPSRTYWAGKHVCVTGGTGFLGYQIVRSLLDLNARVCILALAPALDHPIRADRRIKQIFGDVRTSEVIRDALIDCDVIFHTAGVVAVWGPALKHMDSVHIDGTRNVLQSAPPRARIVHTSSVVAVGASPHGAALTEDHPYNLDRLKVGYVRAKRAAERIALTAAETRDVVVTNPGYMIGPEDYEHSVMGRMCARFWKGRLPVIPPGGLNVVDVRDVARGQLLAAEHGRRGRRYILGGENQDFGTLMAHLAAAAQVQPRWLTPLPRWMLWIAAGIAHARARLRGKEPYPAFHHVRMNRYYWFYQSNRAVRELGYTARPVAQSLEETFAWYKSHNAIPARGVNRWWLRPAA